MARANVGMMLAKVDQSVAEEIPPAAEPATGPAYLKFERKETRVRDDQYEALTLNARRLSKLRAPGNERITENTLIRVAIDMLLARMDDLRGDTDADLRRSVGL